MSGAFPVDLILFAMVAAFLVLRLRSVLGRRQGYERPPREAGAADAPLPDLRPVPEAVPAAPPRGVPDARSPAGQGLARIQAQDGSFDPALFLGGAEGAFRMIVEAFAAGDRATLRNLLSDETYAGFEQAITARETANERQRTEIRNVQDMVIEAADLRGSIAEITVRIVSDQVNMTTAADGSVVSGHDGVTEIVDLWTFQRDLRNSDPSWKLVGTGAV
ncbi:Tim44/TimA family putative adaptor protein [Roseomonas marmotae]|uniref:Tim44 domain-containing protein n=1 Tax=Roseomonas marmotae TaxID=2768161 RepID=A0ABS3KDW4_9PROT|nr:Tim44/TimA family putative adaptor protein [Roseomonas marmotae]MBO1075125.1 Tim44 domain-containing protein [Roseomonas marmotae]QTI79761.1 Tim44 domain-containing protein [Roseomonas marmotae]